MNEHQKIDKKDLVFLPLGGSNEIGMNVNLYHYNGKWIIIDLGAGFADDEMPGVDMVAPDLQFIYDNIENFLGIVLTHGHEDHLGSVGYLFDQLQLPIWATPFTAEIVKNKLHQRGAKKRAKINLVQNGSNFQIGEFDLQMTQITHSIPEMNGILVKTPAGKVFHTGDWKFDPNPVVKPSTDFDMLKKIGEQGIDAMVCDSTNIFNPKFSGSEGDLYPHLKELVKSQKGKVYVTTFASNVARIETLCKVAKACGRRVALVGLSLHKITTFAKDTGYLKDIEPFISDKEIANYPRDKVMVICTGCQGESNAAMTKIADNQNHFLRLTPKDAVIFSSKIIPGNEKKIFKLFNKFVRLGCEVFTEKDHFVHVSGHPSREELQKMYEIIQPTVAIPVHGEPTHIHEHINFAKEIGVPHAVEVQNGSVVKIEGKKSKVLRQVKSGYLAVDGYSLQPKNGQVMQKRKKLMDAGICVVSATTASNGEVINLPQIATPGLLDEREDSGFISYLEEEITDILEANRKTPIDKLTKKIRRRVDNIIFKELRKSPIVEVFVSRG